MILTAFILVATESDNGVFEVSNKTRDSVLAKRVEIAGGTLQRLRGLLGRRELPPGQGLLLAPCNAVHSWFMLFDFDAVFLDERGKVVKTLSKMKPFRISPVVKDARYVLELPAGTVEKTGTREGDQIGLKGVIAH